MKAIFTMVGFHTLVAFLPIAIFVIYKRPHLWHYMLALFLGMLTGFLDAHTDNLQFIVFLPIAFGFFLGFAKPEGSWRMIPMLALWVPLIEFAKSAVGLNATMMNDVVPSFLVLIPTAIGLYIGKAVHSAVAGNRSTIDTIIH